jgi:hypothetical protein
MRELLESSLGWLKEVFVRQGIGPPAIANLIIPPVFVDDSPVFLNI